VDALVADSSADDFATRSLDGFGYGSRSSTPSIPPGFELTHGHPPPALREEPIGKALSKMVPTSAEFTPARGAVRASTPLAQVSTPTSPTLHRPKSRQETSTSTSQAKQDVKALATNTGLSKAIASQSSQTALQSEDFPALDSGKGKAVAATPSKPATPLKASTAVTAKTTPSAPSTKAPAAQNAPEKRTTPGILNISVPSKPALKTPAAPETPVKSAVADSAFPPLPTPSVQSPMVKNTQKTIKVLPTPKTETPTAGSATPSSVTSMFPPNFSTSRQPSLASISRLERPGTPTSEMFSEDASITSTSMSRANSPPPSKIGSAPVRTTTKSMQKKQRREAQREKEKAELDAAATKTEPAEVEIAPIMGRKKKQKKEKPTGSNTRTSTPAASRPASPGASERVAEEPKSTVEVPEAKVSEKQVVEPEVPKVATKATDPKGKGKGKAQRPATPELSPAIHEEEDEPTEKPIPTPASVLQDLISAGLIPNASSLNLLKNPSLSFKHQDTLPEANAIPKLTITAEDRAALLAGHPVHKNAEGPNRMMLTPNGDCVRNLTDEEERRYLELQTRIAKEAGPSSFFSAKHHPASGFTLMGGRAVPNGVPSYFPFLDDRNEGVVGTLLGKDSVPMMDPVSKIQRDEALSYINQYVLPSLSTNSQLERALNASGGGMEVEGILRGGDPVAWGEWEHPRGNIHPGAVPPPGAFDVIQGPRIGDDGTLTAGGLESMTAHFTLTGREGATGGNASGNGQPLGNVSLLTLSEAETAMQMARKETDVLEKKLNALLKKNRRLLLGSGH
jgi:CCR4-NOT transcription complex subunit 4